MSGIANALMRSRANSPEAELTRSRKRLMSEGQGLYDEGVGAIRDFDPEDFLGAEAMQSYFETATATSLNPALAKQRGISSRRGNRGPIASALEGNIYAAFQRDLLGKVGELGGERAGLTLDRGRELADYGAGSRSQGLEVLGRETDIALAREQAAREERARKRSGLGSLIGGVIGFAAGGVPGAAAGARVGGSF